MMDSSWSREMKLFSVDRCAFCVAILEAMHDQKLADAVHLGGAARRGRAPEVEDSWFGDGSIRLLRSTRRGRSCTPGQRQFAALGEIGSMGVPSRSSPIHTHSQTAEQTV
ncbi:hypothetical protein PMIN04_001041 [Paraphaeosphaeria minitans]